MGLLDRFRGGGKSDKEDELEENIEKIREKIQGQGGGQRDLSRPPAPDRESGDRPPRPPAEGDEERSQGPAPPTPDADERARPPRGQLGSQGGKDRQPERQGAGPQERGPSPTDRSRQEDRDGPETAAPQRGAGGQAAGRPGPTQQGGREKPRQPDRRDETGSGEAPDSTELPEPPELTEIDVSEIEGGSLYVTVDTFRDTLQTVADLRTLARDLDDHVGSMEGTLDEDHETARGVEQLLDSADDRIEEMRELMTE